MSLEPARVRPCMYYPRPPVTTCLPRRAHHHYSKLLQPLTPFYVTYSIRFAIMVISEKYTCCKLFLYVLTLLCDDTGDAQVIMLISHELFYGISV